MPYYPSSQIQPNLYTNGGEYTLLNDPTRAEYKGYYYTLSNGNKYTGKHPQDGINNRLILLFPELPKSTLNPITNESNEIIILGDQSFSEGDIDINIVNYNQLYKRNSKTSAPRRFIPSYNLTIPTQTDYELGVFTRYFCKKTNEPKYIEIDKKTSDRLSAKSPNIAWDLYSPISTLWYITGDKTTVAKANKGLVSLIETQQKWYGFPQYFKDQYLKYYLAT